MSKLSSKFYQAPTDQQGKAIQFDVREDEEQQTKFQETVELLVAAGYFRARIKGLSAFDKIVGGMTWCITTCNFDLDIDLLFQESSTIGQKIALVERIVSVLPRMKCPHRIEPHQIQGLDFIHIYPVIQWLVKKAIETRTEMGDLNRAFSLFQYSKTNNQLPNAIETSRTETARQAFLNLKESNAPQRKYIRKDFEKIQDRLIKIQSILLEYDQKNVLLSGLGTNAPGNDTSSSSNKLKQVAMDQQQQKQQQEQAKQQAIEAQEENLKRLMNEMSETGDRGGKGGAAGKISANTIGQILGLQQSQLQQIATEFDQKSSELQSEIDQIEKLLAASDAAGGKGLGGFQHKQRLANILNRQIEQKEAALNEKVNELNGVKEKSNELEEKITEVENKQRELRGELSRLEEFERNADKKDVVELENLVKIHDENKQKENEYKKSCKAELEKIEERNQKLKELETSGGSDENEDETNKQQKILEQYKATKAKEHALKLKIAKKNREISTLKRKLDEVPSRNELSQYQKRFLELYNQMSAFYIQTKQFYLLYNSQEDKRMHMNKVISLYNSINDQFAQAMSSQSNREQFVKQLETILDGIKNNLAKIDNRNLQRKNQLDKLNDTLIGLSDKKRSYFKALKDFQDECKKNELLQSKLQE